MHGVMLMGKNFRVTVLGTGMLSLLVGAAAFAAESRVDALLARLQGADAAGRKQIMKSLSIADRKALHGEYKAMSPDRKAAVRTALAPGKAAKKGSARASKSPNVVGTVQYDTDTVHGFRDNWGGVAGNRFNTGFNNPHTISVVTFQQVGTFGFTPIRVYGAPVGTAAPVLAGTTFGGLPIGTEVTWDLPNIVNHNGTFLAGEQQSGSSNTISTTFVAIAVDVNNGGQGFHGMNITLSGGGFNPNATVFPGQPYNAIMRATGNNLPVELMNFDVQ
jgi:hypothetical protein